MRLLCRSHAFRKFSSKKRCRGFAIEKLEFRTLLAADILTGISSTPPINQPPVAMDDSGFTLRQIEALNSGGTELVGVGDLDLDGAIDFVVQGAGHFAVFERLASGSATTRFSFQHLNRGAAIGDVDHDGKPEIITADFGLYRIFEATGNDTYQQIASFDPSGTPEGPIRTGDYTGDGFLDFLIPTEAGVAVVTSPADNAYSMVYASGPGGGNYQIAKPTGNMDLDMDGYPELVGANGGLGPHTDIHEQDSLIQQIAGFVAFGTGDSDGNGLQEIIGQKWNGATLQIYESTGSNQYTEIPLLNPPVVASPDLQSTFAVDMNNDGRTEIVTFSSEGSRQWITVYTRTGGRLDELYNSGDLLHSIISYQSVGDTNDDGISELAILDGGTLRFMQFESASSFVINENTPLNLSSAALIWNDHDIDTPHDQLVITEVSGALNGTVSLLGDGSIHFEPYLNFYGVAGFDYTLSDGNASSVAHVFINVLSVNNDPSDILLSSNSIAENLPAGSVVGNLQAIDVDLEENFVYTLVAGDGSQDNALFEIDSLGRLSTAETLNFETKSSYSIRVAVRDGGGALFEKSFTVLVVDQPEGTSGNDVFTLRIENNLLSVTLGNVFLGNYVVSPSITIFGSGGTDTLKMIGGNERDSIQLFSTEFDFNSAYIQMSSIETLSIDAGLGNDLFSIFARPEGVTKVTLLGNGGDDTFDFATSNNNGTIFVEDSSGADTLYFGSSTTPISVSLANPSTQTVNPNLSLNLKSGSAFENLIGGSSNDTLIGNSLSNWIVGGMGNDSMHGSGGNDTYDFDFDVNLGSDTIADTSGIDTINFSQTTFEGAVINLALQSPQIVSSGLTLTIPANIENVIGTQANDSITGNSASNRFEGVGGDDEMSGGDGNDTYIFAANSQLGSDSIDDTNGLDTLDFSGTIAAGIEVNLDRYVSQIVSSNLELIIRSGTNLENIIGSNANDILIGNVANNTLTGGPGNDTLAGGKGNDNYVFNTATNLGEDEVIDTLGIDTIDFSRSTSGSGIRFDLGSTATQVLNNNLSLRLASSSDIERVTGTSLDDELYGNALDNIIIGGPGNDSIHGQAGNDTYILDADLSLGIDTLEDGSGIDTLNFALTTSKFVNIDLTFSSQQSVTSSFSLVLPNPLNFENLIGGRAGNHMVGNSNGNTFTGGTSDDTFVGAGGDDIYIINATLPSGSDTIDASGGGFDTLDFSSTKGTGVTIDISTVATQIVRPGFLSLRLTGNADIDKVIGSSLNDTIIGNAINNVLLGGAGVDSILGKEGRDILFGGQGGDSLNGGDDDDLIISGTTLFDVNVSSLRLIATEWFGPIGYDLRLARLRSGADGIPRLSKGLNVRKDNSSNSLMGGGGRDWFFADLVAGTDGITDLALDEFTDEL